MILGQDEAVMFPTVNLYDSGMMQMYISAVKDLYEQGLRDYDNFVSKYGDFTSPIAGDVEYWNNHTMGPILDLVNDMYENGIDPTRNPEARAMILNAMRKIPYGKLSQMRQSAKAAEDYMKARGVLAAKGLWNPDYEKFLLGGKTLESWNTATDGMWTRTSPGEYSDLNAATSAWVDNLKDRDLGLDPTGQYRMSGVTEDDIRAALTPHLSGFVNSDLGRYHMDNARKELVAEGIENPTQALIMDRLQQNIVTAQHERVHTTYDVDDYAKMAKQNEYAMALDNLRTKNDMKAEAARQRLAHDYRVLEAADFNLDGTVDADEAAIYSQAMQAQYDGTSSSSGSGSGGSSDVPYIASGTGLEYMLNEKYVANREKTLKDYDNETTKLYKKMSPEMRKIADKVRTAYDTLYSSKTATKEEVARAKKVLEASRNNRDKNFINWRDHLIGSNYEWLKHSSTQGKFAANSINVRRARAEQLRWYSREIYDNNNRISDLTVGQKKDLDGVLGYTIKNDGGDLLGKMTAQRDFEDITILKMTGTLKYSDKTIPKKISNIIRGKNYTVTKENIANRSYAAGRMNGKQYNIIHEVATFDDPDVVAALDNIPEEQLKEFGINKVGDTYEIPITTRNGHGLARAEVDSRTDERVGGKAQRSKLLAYRLAYQFEHINE